MTLHGRAQLVHPYKRSYTLSWTLGKKGYRVFSLDVRGSHNNTAVDRNRWENQTHKQRWEDEYNNFAYTPDEIIPDEPSAAFLEFCGECNIVFAGRLGPVPPF